MGLLGVLFGLIVGADSVNADEIAEDLTDLSIEDLLQVEIISASRFAKKNSQSASTVSIVTAEDIRAFGWRTLAEALNAIRGLYVNNDRNYSYLGVRGFLHPNDYNSRVLLMIDGQRMNENIYDGGYVGQEFLIDISLIERIEFIPGSGSSIYGANAFTGLINVVTKNGQAIDGVQVAGEYGTFDAYKGRLSVGKTFDNGADIVFSASHFHSDGPEKLYYPEFDNPATNNGIATNMDRERADRLFAKFRYGDFTLSGGYVDRWKRVPTAAWETLFNDPQHSTVDAQFFGNVRYSTALTSNTDFLAKLFYNGYDYEGDYPYVDGETRLLNHDHASGRWWGGELQLTTRAFEGHRIMVGVEYQYDQRQNQHTYDIHPYTQYLHADRSGHRVELYLQDDIQLLDDLIFSVGGRLDYHHMLNGLQLNPRLGLIWHPIDEAVFKLLYSSTFRAPNAWERDYVSFNADANPNNQEERIKSYEAVVEWQPLTHLKLTGNLFYNELSGLLEQDTEPGYGAVGPFLNVGDYEAFGFELEAEHRSDNGRLLKASYTYSDVREESDGGVWSYASPRNLFKLHYAEPLFDRFALLGIENVFVDRRRTPQNSIADAYYQFNVNLSSDRLLPGLDISVGAYNLFDTRYPMFGGTGPADITQDIIPMNGREFRLKLQWTFR
ncbi:MAG: hypothetical protein Kow0065_20130 [Methylomicrobium sp.]